ncbi:MAG: hypothetical protein P8X64_04210 [Anaerolineales bacterium]
MVEKAENLVNTYRANTWLLKRYIADVSHAESLRTPNERINCMNWILGHIISGRHKALALLDEDGFWDESRMQTYQTGSPAITGDGQELKFEQLKQELERSQVALEQALGAATKELLHTVKTTDRGEKAVHEHVDGLGWHETFHVGQAEILRAYAHDEPGDQ